MEIHRLCKIYFETQPSADAKCEESIPSSPCIVGLQMLCLRGSQNQKATKYLNAYDWNARISAYKS
jgi:hypothetical protein